VPAAEEPLPVSADEAKALFADLASEPALVIAVSGGPDSIRGFVSPPMFRFTGEAGARIHAATPPPSPRPLRARILRQETPVKPGKRT